MQEYSRSKLGIFLEARRGKISRHNFAAQLGICRSAYYDMLKGRSPRPTTLFALAKALRMDSRSIILLAYCDGADRAIGRRRSKAFRAILRQNQGWIRFNSNVLLWDYPRLSSVRAIADQAGLEWNGRSIGFVDLVLAAYCHEMPIEINTQV
jgi:hypothetical protein